ncbi:MAG: hypothetical protein R2873_29125 [Caldilineaceae bacterium]
MKYRVHRFDLRMTKRSVQPGTFLNSLEGEVVAVVPNVTMAAFWMHRVDFVLVIERIGGDGSIA